MDTTTKSAKLQLPWIIALILGLILFFLLWQGWWQVNAAPAQVQVPMFYDAHYFFPRPWTQEQSAPGIPDPAPALFANPDQISQEFFSGSDNLAMISVWLSGSPGSFALITLQGTDGTSLAGEIPLQKGQSGGFYNLTFDPLTGSRGIVYTLTISPSPGSTAELLGTRTVGGDRLGGSIRLNEYNRPGNLLMKSYARGIPGTWWLESIGEQLLPSLFRQRIAQYKPGIFKGPVFSVLLLTLAGLSFLYLFLARPQKEPSLRTLNNALGWSVVLILGMFLLWQIAASRVQLGTSTYALYPLSEPVAGQPDIGTGYRRTTDFVSDLWTAERDPEARFLETDLVDGYPAIRVPANARITYPLVVAPGSRLAFGFTAAGQGELVARIALNDQPLYEETFSAEPDPLAADDRWQEIDLSPWAGQAGFLTFSTSSNEEDLAGFWLWPRLETSAPWLHPDPLPADMAVQSLDVNFADKVGLAGFALETQNIQAGDQTRITLYWRPLKASSENATVFLHLLDENGDLVAQNDAPPVGGAYPPAVWQQGTIIADEHLLTVPPALASGSYSLAVGLYDPATLGRWQMHDNAGRPLPEDRVFLPGALEVQP